MFYKCKVVMHKMYKKKSSSHLKYVHWKVEIYWMVIEISIWSKNVVTDNKGIVFISIILNSNVKN